MGDYEDYRQREKGDRDPHAIANKIIFTHNYPGNESYSFLLVEGETDRTFYMNLIDQSKCQIVSTSNKSMVIQVLSILEEMHFLGVLAIVDADFDVLEDKLPASPNMCYTDTHDLETMLIQSPALEKVLGEFGSAEKIEQMTLKAGKDVRTLLLECGIALGYLRWVSLREKLELKFEDLQFDKFIRRDALTVDQANFILAVKNKSQESIVRNKLHKVVTEVSLQVSIQKLQNGAHDPWHVCCGHDLVCVLSRGLHGVISRGQNNTQHVSPEILEKSLRLAFERAYFYKTRLYLFIKQWEILNAPYIILASV